MSLRRAATSILLSGLMVSGVASCSKTRPPPTASSPEGGPDSTGPAQLPAIARAENLRRAGDLPRAANRSHDVVVRRAAARALARILDADGAPLVHALEDEDDEVVSWAAYGLGESCKAHEDGYVRALAARLASSRGGDRPRVTILRALGRCGGDPAEQTLRAWLGRGAGPTGEAVAYALGEIAARRGSLSSESVAVLLDAAEGAPPMDAALYALGRMEGGVGEDLAARLAAAARAALERPGVARVFALRALARSGDVRAVADLARVLASETYSPAERAEAARELGRLRKPAQAALAEALPALVPDRAEGLAGSRFEVLVAALDALGDDPPEPALWAIGRLEPAPGAPAAVVRRASLVRCAAAQKLARGAWGSEVMLKCDVGDGEAGARARLASLDRQTFGKERRALWLELARSPHARVREAALELIARHAELADAARMALAEALASKEPGVVAAAAHVVEAHPERAFVLADSERRAALDPAAPPPPANPARELDRGVAAALRAALARPWSEDVVETRIALLAAALAAGLDEARAYARVACADPNVTVRARTAKALATAGEKGAACPPPDAPGDAAAELGHELDHPARVVFDTDAGLLAVRFDPGLAPIAVTRLVALARSGFYTGIAVHRVVPGFVVQLGDRGGDGYGGSGKLLRCETSPVPFEPFDVGVALAGRDTGSSQLFVTLARHPHLDGQYAWIGRAEGAWSDVAEGDVVRAVRVEE